MREDDIVMLFVKTGTPPEFAVRKVKKYLASGVDINRVMKRRRRENKMMFMDVAMKKGHLHIVEALLRGGPKTQGKLLTSALENWNMYFCEKEQNPNSVKTVMNGKMEYYTKYWPRDLEIRYFNIVKYLYEKRMRKKWNDVVVNNLTGVKLRGYNDEKLFREAVKNFSERQRKQLEVEKVCGWVINTVTNTSIGNDVMIGYLTWTDVKFKSLETELGKRKRVC